MANVVKTMNAVKTVGEYQNKEGNQKKEYLTIGTLFIYEDGGQSLKIKDGISVSGNINFYEKQNRDQPQQNQNQGYGQNQQSGYQDQPQQQSNYQQHNVQQNNTNQNPNNYDNR